MEVHRQILRHIFPVPEQAHLAYRFRNQLPFAFGTLDQQCGHNRNIGAVSPKSLILPESSIIFVVISRAEEIAQQMDFLSSSLRGDGVLGCSGAFEAVPDLFISLLRKSLLWSEFQLELMHQNVKVGPGHQSGVEP